MAKGSVAKADITKKILGTFEGSFLYNGDKEIRIPFEENGEYIEIKVALTCAKEAVGCGNATSMTPQTQEPAPLTPPTQEELDNVANLIAQLNL